MKKYSKLLAVTLCASIALASTGCGGTDKLKNAITNNKTASSDKAKDSSDGNVKCLDYVTLGDYSTINIKKSEIDKSTKEQITKNIKSTGDYTKVKKGKIKKGDIVYANATYSNGTSNYIRFNSKSGKQGWVKVAELSKLPTNMFKRIVYRTH